MGLTDVEIDLVGNSEHHNRPTFELFIGKGARNVMENSRHDREYNRSFYKYYDYL